MAAAMDRNRAIALCTAAAVGLASVVQAAPLPDLSGWHEAAQKAAKDMQAKYGDPDEATDTMLVWHDSGPWVRTIVYKEAIEHDFPMPHVDVLEQFIHMDVPPDYFDDLAHYDGSVIVERTKGEISARCDKEPANFLAINLAHDIINDERTVEEARQHYAETIRKLMAGETPEYTAGLTFEPAQQDVTNPDESLL